MTTNTLEYAFQFSEEERRQLTSAILELPPIAYTDYYRFLTEARTLAASPRVPARFSEFCAASADRDMAETPILMTGNCPIDPVLPVFDSEDPVRSKYERKTTFVAEGFLAIYAVLTRTEIIAHNSVNAGDFFHDIYPKASMYASQSQKTLENLRFHRDFTNHFVSPDYVVTLTLRNAPNVCSTFVTNKTAIDALPADAARTLREPIFFTPIDDVSTRETSIKFEPPAPHPAIAGDSNVKVFEDRTVGLTPEASKALEILLATLHATKLTWVTQPGDSVAFSNMHIVHGRELSGPTDLEALRRRWLIKTHNVNSLRSFEQHFIPDRYGVVNG